MRCCEELLGNEHLKQCLGQKSLFAELSYCRALLLIFFLEEIRSNNAVHPILYNYSRLPL